MTTEAEKEVAEAHEALRTAIIRATLADHRLSRELGCDHPDHTRHIEDHIDFMQRAHLADYVVGAMFVDLGTDEDYHAVSVTDGGCTSNRSVGTAVMTADFLRGR